MLGGSMRQAGILASAASYALKHHFCDLYRDHELASRLAQGLREIRGIGVVRHATNMFFATFEPQQPEPVENTSARFLSHLKKHGIVVGNANELRFVPPRDISGKDIDHTLSVIRFFFDRVMRTA